MPPVPAPDLQDLAAELDACRKALIHANHRADMALTRETEVRVQLRQFLSMVSHEFRTPLAIIDSASQMLMLRADPLQQPRLNVIRNAISRLVDLISKRLSDDNSTCGLSVLQEQMIDIAAVLQAVIDNHRALTPNSRIALTTETLPQIWGDVGLLELGFNSLIRHAVKTPGAESVDIRAACDAHEIVITVRNHGSAIVTSGNGGDVGRIFSAAQSEGENAGMHVVRQIVALHGGRVSAEEADDGGLILTMCLQSARE